MTRGNLVVQCSEEISQMKRSTAEKLVFYYQNMFLNLIFLFINISSLGFDCEGVRVQMDFVSVTFMNDRCVEFVSWTEMR